MNHGDGNRRSRCHHRATFVLLRLTGSRRIAGDRDRCRRDHAAGARSFVNAALRRVAAVSLVLAFTQHSTIAADRPLPLPIREAPEVYLRPITGVAFAVRANNRYQTREIDITGAPMDRLRDRARHLHEALAGVDATQEHRQLAAELLDPAIFGRFEAPRVDPIESAGSGPPRPGDGEMIDLQARILIDADLSAFRVGLGLRAWPSGRCVFCGDDARYYWYVVPHPSLPDWATWEQNGIAWASIPSDEIQRMLRDALRGAWTLMMDDLREPRRKSLGKRWYPEPTGARTRRMHVVHRVDDREWLHGDPYGQGQWTVYSMPTGWKPRPTRR